MFWTKDETSMRNGKERKREKERELKISWVWTRMVGKWWAVRKQEEKKWQKKDDDDDDDGGGCRGDGCREKEKGTKWVLVKHILSFQQVSCQYRRLLVPIV